MASNARIDELKKKFDENPRRYFAPLANEYRKAGDLEQAIAICREHLPQQPGHMSGHIVFGQALFEAKDLDQSRQIFEAALALDPENLIALKHLGDIAFERKDVTKAREWYQRILEADPRNEEILAQLQSLQGAETDAPIATVEAPPAPPAPPAAFATTPTVAEPFAPPTIPARPQPQPPEPVPAISADNAATIELDMASFAPPAEAEKLVAAEAPTLAFDTFDLATGSMVAAASPTQPLPPPPPPLDLEGPLDLELTDMAAPSSPPSPEPALEPNAFAGGVEETTVPVSAATDDRAEELESLAPPAPAFVTETMAELYLKQGFRAEAISVYEQLIAQRPTDSDLRARLDRIRRGESPHLVPATGPSARAFFAGLARRSVTNGRGAATTRDTEPAGSIDTLFGSAPRSSGDESAALVLAGAFARTDGTGGGGSPSGTPHVSSDEFFGGTAGSPTPSASQSEEAEDVAQFNSWLDGLKKP